MKAVRPLALALAGAAAISATAGTALSARASLPLTKRVLRANEIPGYVPAGPRTRPLSLSAFAKATGDGPEAARILAKYGFIKGAYENLKGPTSPPPDGNSNSSVGQLQTAKRASELLAFVTHKYYTRSPGMGIRLVRFRATGIPRATAAHFSRGNVHEYDLLFTRGRYFYEEDIFTRGQALTQAQFVTYMHDFYERVR